MIIGLAAIFGFRLFSTYLTQAYLQSAEQLHSDNFINPPKAFNLSPNQLIKLLKPLYRLSQNGDYWGRTFTNHREQVFGISTCISDTSFFYKRIGQNCRECVQLMLIIHAGNEQYGKLCENTEKKFNRKNREWDNMKFSGLKIETKENGYQVHQKIYIKVKGII